jgi:FdrA protein
MELKVSDLLQRSLVIINIGVRKFAESLVDQEVEFVHVDWSPPAGGDEELIDLLDELL